MSDIFNGFVQKHLIFFGEFTEQQKATFDELAQTYRGEYVVVTISPKEFRAMDFFDVTVDDAPTLRLVDLRHEPMYKYK